ncbi:transposase [Comamonas terrigena]|uniref:transposase n=1 Tax=Comamonas terrigena TaxID=32013 RepID=UPI002449B041|nr:transposase [Comamonas terrigena]MDH1702141.1 transposase [Comamonas terrigena]
MARLPRLTLPGMAHYVIQRGNNLQPIFEDVQDYETMKDLMREMARRFQVDLHAYVLLPAQFHVLATPETEEGLPLFMQSVGRSYVRYFNNRHGRSGTLWEGRYRSTVLEASAYLLPCMVVLETQPVAEGQVGRPQDYLWSSYAHNAGVQQDSLVRSHAQYWALANTPFAREAAYQRTVEHGVSAAVAEEVLAAASKGWALGSPDFVAQLQHQTQRRLTRRRPGRPAQRPVEASPPQGGEASSSPSATAADAVFAPYQGN